MLKLFELVFKVLAGLLTVAVAIERLLARARMVVNVGNVIENLCGVLTDLGGLIHQQVTG